MLLRLAIFYAIGGASGFAMFFLGFAAGLFGSDPIIFYRGLKILLVTSVLHWGLLAAWTWFVWRNQMSMAHAFAVTMGSIALCSTFLIVIPVSLDRSVSVFLLGYMGNHPVPLSKQELEDVLVSKYVKEYQSIERRMAEQIMSGNIEQTADGRYVLTARGEAFVSSSKRIASAFDADMKFLDPK